jgi:hypothetical protein
MLCWQVVSLVHSNDRSWQHWAAPEHDDASALITSSQTGAQPEATAELNGRRSGVSCFGRRDYNDKQLFSPNCRNMSPR